MTNESICSLKVSVWQRGVHETFVVISISEGPTESSRGDLDADCTQKCKLGFLLAWEPALPVPPCGSDLVVLRGLCVCVCVVCAVVKTAIR